MRRVHYHHTDCNCDIHSDSIADYNGVIIAAFHCYVLTNIFTNRHGDQRDEHRVKHSVADCFDDTKCHGYNNNDDRHYDSVIQCGVHGVYNGDHIAHQHVAGCYVPVS